MEGTESNIVGTPCLFQAHVAGHHLNDAHPLAKKAAHIVTALPGGQGAVREVIEILLRAQGRWNEILRHYEVEL